MKKPKLKLKKGDKVWFKMAVNGVIKSVNQELGYTILLDTQEATEAMYFDDDDVEITNP